MIALTKVNHSNPEFVVSVSKDDHGISPTNTGEAVPLGGNVTELGYRQSKDGNDLPSSRPSSASRSSFRAVVLVSQVDACTMPPHRQARTSKGRRHKGYLVN